MSRYYGVVEGKAKTEATRQGTARSGLTVHAASWNGAVRVHLQPKQGGGEDDVTIEFVPWYGSGVNKVLYRGPWPKEG